MNNDETRSECLSPRSGPSQEALTELHESAGVGRASIMGGTFLNGKRPWYCFVEDDGQKQFPIFEPLPWTPPPWVFGNEDAIMSQFHSVRVHGGLFIDYEAGTKTVVTPHGATTVAVSHEDITLWNTSYGMKNFTTGAMHDVMHGEDYTGLSLTNCGVDDFHARNMSRSDAEKLLCAVATRSKELFKDDSHSTDATRDRRLPPLPDLSGVAYGTRLTLRSRSPLSAPMPQPFDFGVFAKNPEQPPLHRSQSLKSCSSEGTLVSLEELKKENEGPSPEFTPMERRSVFSRLRTALSGLFCIRSNEDIERF